MELTALNISGRTEQKAEEFIYNYRYFLTEFYSLLSSFVVLKKYIKKKSNDHLSSLREADKVEGGCDI